MAYNNIFPMGYQPMYYPQQYQQPVQQMNQSVQQNQQLQVQNGGVVNVQNEQEARDYLVANGTSVTFIDTQNKKIYIKTKGFSNFDVPTFEKYKLIKDEEEPEINKSVNIEYANKEDIKTLQTEVEEIQTKIKQFIEKSVDNE